MNGISVTKVPDTDDGSAARDAGSANEVRDMLRNMAHRFLTLHCTRDLRVRAEGGEWPEALWRTAMDAGLHLAAVPEELGGAGTMLSDAAVIMRAVGWHAVPLPLVETVLGNWLLAQAGCPPAGGPLAIAPVSHGQMLTLSHDSAGWTMTGNVEHIPWARHATDIVCVAEAESGRQFVVKASVESSVVHASTNVAGEPRDRLAFDQVPVGDAMHELPGDRDHAALFLQLGALARCQQMAGAMEWILERCCAFAGERVQFGKPIGGFQAPQHMLAVMATQVSAAVVAADAAMNAFANDEADAAAAAGYAKARVGEAAGEVTALAHQLHGAMGYSHEYPLHWRTRRLWAWRDEFGGERFWNQRAGAVVARHGAAQFWNDLAT